MRKEYILLGLLLSLSKLWGQEIHTYKFSIVTDGVSVAGMYVSHQTGDIRLRSLDNSRLDSGYFEVESVDNPLKVKIRHSEPRYQYDTTYEYSVDPNRFVVLRIEAPVYTIGTIEIRTSFALTVGAPGVNRGAGIGFSLRQDQLNTRGSNTLSEALDVIPGVHYVSTGVGIGKPMIRGFVGNRVQVLQNGVAQEGQQWGMDHGLEIDQFAQDRITIVNGPAALVRGAGLQTGAVEVFNDPPLRWSSGSFGEVQTMYKSNNQLLGVSARYGYQEFNEKDLRSVYDIRVSGQQFSDYRVPANQFLYNGFQLELPEGILKNTAGEEWNATLGYYTQLDKQRSLRATYAHFDQAIGLFPGATGIPRAFDISNLGERRDIQTPSQQTSHDRLGLRYITQYGQVTSSYTLGLQYNNRRELSQPHAHGLTYIDSNDLLALQLQLFTLDVKYDYTHKSYEREFKWGLSAQYQNNAQDGWEFILPAFERVEGGLYSYYGWSRNAWNINAAIRLDGAGMQVNGYRQPWFTQPDSLVERVADFSRLFIVPSASFGWEWVNGDFVLSGHSGFVSRAPEVNELGSNGVHHGTFRHEIGSEDLDAEYGVNLDASAFYEVPVGSWKMKTKITAYTLNYWNFIYLNPSGRFSPLPDAGQTYVYVQSPMYQWGGELYLEMIRELSNNHPYLSHVLSLIVMADVVKSRNTDIGENLPFQSPASITGLVEYNRWHGTYGVEIQNVLSQNRVARNERATPGYSLVNAYASYSIPVPHSLQEFKISLRFQNLTNQSYMRHLSRYRILNLPEQGFNLIVQAQYSF